MGDGDEGFTGSSRPQLGPSDYEYKRCRARAHQWQDSDDNGEYPWPQAHPDDRMSDICLLCGERCFRWLDAYGNDMEAPVYIPPDGFRVDEQDLPDKAGWRRTWLEERKADRAETRRRKANG